MLYSSQFLFVRRSDFRVFVLSEFRGILASPIQLNHENPKGRKREILQMAEMLQIHILYIAMKIYSVELFTALLGCDMLKHSLPITDW